MVLGIKKKVINMFVLDSVVWSQKIVFYLENVMMIFLMKGLNVGLINVFDRNYLIVVFCFIGLYMLFCVVSDEKFESVQCRVGQIYLIYVDLIKIKDVLIKVENVWNIKKELRFGVRVVVRLSKKNDIDVIKFVW